MIKFKAINANTGPLTVNERRVVTLQRNGKPLMAGDLAVGEEVTFDRETGEVLDPPKESKP
jgi:hypothetical protein